MLALNAAPSTMPQSALSVLLALCALLPTSLAYSQYVSMLPNGNTFGVLNGHRSSSGGSGCALAATPALVFAHASAAT